MIKFTFFLLVSLSIVIVAAASINEPRRQVEKSERIAAGIPANICPDETFTLWTGPYAYFCYQKGGHPVSDVRAYPWCPSYGVDTFKSIGVYSSNTSMECPPNTISSISSPSFMWPTLGPISKYCFYSIPVFQQQSNFTSYCTHWNDPYPFGVGYSFVWNN